MRKQELIGKEVDENILKEIRKLEDRGYVVTIVGNKVYEIEKEVD